MNTTELMSESDRRKANRLLVLTKQGDAAAQQLLASFLAEHFYFRIRKFNVRDPAVTQEDLAQIFWMAIYNHLPLLDERGNPLYHAGQRGYWAVCTYIDRVNRLYDAQDTSVEGLEDYEPWQTPSEYDDVVAEVIRNEEIGEAYALVWGTTGETWSPRDRQMFLWMREHPACLEAGALNRVLAAEFGYSQQRASQIKARVRQQLSVTVAA